MVTISVIRRRLQATPPLARTAFAAAAVLLIVAAAPLLLSAADVFFVTSVFVAILFTQAVAFTVGYGGVGTFGNQLFYGAAAYVSGYLVTANLVHDALILVIVGLFVGAVCAAVTLVFLRGDTGFVFGMITLAIGQTVYIFVEQSPYLNGTSGIAGIPRGGVFGVSLESGDAFYYFVLLVVAAALLAIALIRTSVFGQVLRALRVNAVRTESLGASGSRYRAWAVIASGAATGVAGVLFALTYGAVDPNAFFWTTGAIPILAALIGGIRSFVGPTVGVVIYLGLSYVLSQYTFSYLLWTAIVVLLLFLIAPEGVAGVFRSLWRRRAHLLSARSADRAQEATIDV